MKCKYFLVNCFFLFISLAGYSRPGKHLLHKGKLFIIGGGERSPELMNKLIRTARLAKKDYIVILPMSSESPDTSFYYICQDLLKVCTNPVANLNFTRQRVHDQGWLDSLRKAKLIFITGGDQNRFMGIVLHTPVHKAIIAAFSNGSTIAGSSAGAAVMSKQMITGNEFSGDSIVTGSFKKIRHHLVEVKEGLGLLNTAIVDQHFIVRSRYNRLLSVLAEYPLQPCIGIDEATAIIVEGKKITVTGEGQVLKLTAPPQRTKPAKSKALVNMKNVHLDILTAGDIFFIK